MKAYASCLYVGQVVHQRFAPVRHRLRYPMFQMLFDLDEVTAIARRHALFSHNGFNALSFHDRDHGDGGTGTLRAYVDRTLAKAGVIADGGPIRLLCMPRVFGHVFNPLSIYYCHDRAGALLAMIYEVNNTFGQRHTYVIPAGPDPDGVIRQSCRKGFYVSPFMDMAMRYEFDLSNPGATIATLINGFDLADQRLIFAAFNGRRREISDRALLGALLGFPFLTLGVVAAIHWEAALLFLKGMRLRRRPEGPAIGMTVVADETLAPPLAR